MDKEKLILDNIKNSLKDACSTFVGTSAIAMQVHISEQEARAICLKLEEKGKIAKWHQIDDVWILTGR